MDRSELRRRFAVEFGLASETGLGEALLAQTRRSIPQINAASGARPEAAALAHPL